MFEVNRDPLFILFYLFVCLKILCWDGNYWGEKRKRDAFESVCATEQFLCTLQFKKKKMKKKKKHIMKLCMTLAAQRRLRLIIH